MKLNDMVKVAVKGCKPIDLKFVQSVYSAQMMNRLALDLFCKQMSPIVDRMLKRELIRPNNL